MTKFKNILKLLLLILLVVFLIYAGSVVYDRYFLKKQIINLENSSDEKNDLEKLKNRPPLDTEINFTEENDISQNTEKIEEERKSQFEISLTDCKFECQHYGKEIEKFSYCQQVCGLNSTLTQNSNSENNTNSENTQENNCEKIEKLEKDYCWRNLAIKEKKFEICQKIEDKNIFQQCKNRITEDMLDFGQSI
jgi:hypothetical protein